MTTTADLTIVRGDTYVRELAILAANGAAYDLTGATVWVTVKPRGDTAADDAGAVASLYWVFGGASSGIAVADPTTGVLTVTIPAAATAGMTAGERLYRYDVQVSKAGAVATPITGTITVLRDTTIRTTTP